MSPNFGFDQTPNTQAKHCDSLETNLESIFTYFSFHAPKLMFYFFAPIGSLDCIDGWSMLNTHALPLYCGVLMPYLRMNAAVIKKLFGNMLLCVQDGLTGGQLAALLDLLHWCCDIFNSFWWKLCRHDKKRHWSLFFMWKCRCFLFWIRCWIILNSTSGRALKKSLLSERWRSNASWIPSELQVSALLIL